MAWMIVLSAFCVLLCLSGARRFWQSNGGAPPDEAQRAAIRLKQLHHKIERLRHQLTALEQTIQQEGYRPTDRGPYQSAAELLSHVAQAKEQIDSAWQQSICLRAALDALLRAPVKRLWLRIFSCPYKKLWAKLGLLEEKIRDAQRQIARARAVLIKLEGAPTLVAHHYGEVVLALQATYEHIGECERNGLAGQPLREARHVAECAEAMLHQLPVYLTDPRYNAMLPGLGRGIGLGAWKVLTQSEQQLDMIDRQTERWQADRQTLLDSLKQAVRSWMQARQLYTDLPTTIDGRGLAPVARICVGGLRQLAQRCQAIEIERLPQLTAQAHALGHACDRLAARLQLAVQQDHQLRHTLAEIYQTEHTTAAQMRDATMLQPHPLTWPQAAARLITLHRNLVRHGPTKRSREIRMFGTLLTSAAQLANECQNLGLAVQASLDMRQQYHQTWQQANIPDQPDWTAPVVQLLERVARYRDPKWQPHVILASLLQEAAALAHDANQLTVQHRALLHIHSSPAWAEAASAPRTTWPTVDQALSQLQDFVALRDRLHQRAARCQATLTQLDQHEQAAMAQLRQTIAGCSGDLHTTEQILRRLSAAALYPIDTDDWQAELQSVWQIHAAADPGVAQPVLPQIEQCQQQADRARALAASLHARTTALAEAYRQLLALRNEFLEITSPAWLQFIRHLKEQCGLHADTNWPQEDRPQALLIDARTLQHAWRQFEQHYPQDTRYAPAQINHACAALRDLAQQLARFNQRCERIGLQLTDVVNQQSGLRHQLGLLKQSLHQLQSLLNRLSDALAADLRNQLLELRHQLRDCEESLNQRAAYSLVQQELALLEQSYQHYQQVLRRRLGDAVEQVSNTLNHMRRQLHELNADLLALPMELITLRLELQQIVSTRADLLDLDQDQARHLPVQPSSAQAISDLDHLLSTYEWRAARQHKLELLLVLCRFAQRYQVCDSAIARIKDRLEAGWPRLEGNIDDREDRWRDLKRRVAADLSSLPLAQLPCQLNTFLVEIGQHSDPLPRISERLDSQQRSIRHREDAIRYAYDVLQSAKKRLGWGRRSMVVAIDELLIETDKRHDRLTSLPRKSTLTHRQALDALDSILEPLESQIKELQEQRIIGKLSREVGG